MKKLFTTLLIALTGIAVVHAAQGSAVYNASTKTLTFYYDSQAHSGDVGPLPTGNTTQPWWSQDTNVSANVQRVVFDPSFASLHLTSGYYWFAGLSSLTSINGLEYFNTDQMVNMNSMFRNCSALTSIDLSHFDTQNVTNMYCMFIGCSGLTGLDLSHFDTGNVTNMSEMFSGCSALGSLDVTGLNTQNVTTMLGMFRSCSNLVTLDLSSFNTYNVIEMAAMFNGCSKLTTIIAGDDWNVGGVTESNNMFRNCTTLVGGAGTTYSSSHMDKSYAHFDYGPSSNAPGYLTPVVMPYANFDTNTTTLTFYCDNQYIFRNSGRLDLNQEEGNLPGWRSFNGDVTSIVFDPSFAQARPKTTYYWFEQMENLTSITGLEYLNTSETTSMYGMFYGCEKLTSLDLSSFNTDKVTSIGQMFCICSNLEKVNLGSFNTSAVTLTRAMFSQCRKLHTIYVGEGWDMSNVVESSSSIAMFANCSNIIGMRGTTFDADHTDKEYAHVDGGPDNPGYLRDANPRGFRHGGLWYEPNDATHVTLIEPQNGTTYTGNITIPDAFQYNGNIYEVNKIEPLAFTGSSVISIEVPATVTYIGEKAFYGAQNLAKLVLNTTKAPNKHDQLGEQIAGNNATEFVCYVSNNNLPAWELKYSYNFMPWIKIHSDNQYTTFASVNNVTLPSALTAYRVTGFNSAKRMATTTTVANGMIPARNGVVLKGQPNTRYLMQQATNAPALGDNMLRSLIDIEDIPYAPFAANPDDTKAYFLGNSGERWIEFANSIDLFMGLNTGIAYLAVDKSLLGNDYTSPVKLDIWEAAMPGDVNGDGEVDVRAITALIDIIMNSGTSGTADVNGDGEVDVRDITALIDIIMNSGKSKTA